MKLTGFRGHRRPLAEVAAAAFADSARWEGTVGQHGDLVRRCCAGRPVAVQEAVRKIRDRFANSRALRRGGRQPTERQAKKLLRPKRRALSETVAPPTP